jgi:excisionase family DNA binding protein
MTERLLYDKASAAAMLFTSQGRVDELRRTGRLRAVKDGSKWKFRHSDLENYVESLSETELVAPVSARALLRRPVDPQIRQHDCYD